MTPEGKDDELAKRLLAGDALSHQLVRSWIRGGFVRYRSRLSEDLEDIEQEVVIDLLKALEDGRFQGGSSLRTFMVSMVHHKCIDRVRAASRRTWVEIGELNLKSPLESPSDSLRRKEKISLALKIASEMPEACRELWQMLEQGLSYREMSERLDVAEVTLRSRVMRCRQRAVAVREKFLEENLQRNPGGVD